MIVELQKYKNLLKFSGRHFVSLGSFMRCEQQRRGSERGEWRRSSSKGRRKSSGREGFGESAIRDRIREEVAIENQRRSCLSDRIREGGAIETELEKQLP
jgi:hypothetical protein